MVADVSVARAVLASVRARVERLRRDPSRRYRWLPNQDAFIRSSAKVRMIRQGNQWGGKTTAALYEVLCHLRGSHPHKAVPAAPVEWWVMCAESSQSIGIQRKMWDLLDPDEVDPGTEFDDVRGFRGRVPVLRLKNGSICRFKTTGQRTITLAGATLDGVLFDEPPTSLRLYTEVSKRVMHRGGVILLSMTPVNAGPLDWLRELVESGSIEDHHARLEPAALIPVGSTVPIRLPDGTLCDAAWVDRTIGETPEYEREVVCHGEWENKASGRVFTPWDPAKMVSDAPPEGVVHLLLGVDYGDKVGKQYAVLVAMDPGQNDRLWILDETPPTEHSTLEMDAHAILALLARNDLRWGEIDRATGDRTYERGAVTKSNRELHAELARLLRTPTRRLTPRIHTAKRVRNVGRHTVDPGVRYVYRAMVRDEIRVHPRCTRMIEAIERWDGRQTQSRHTGLGVFVDSYYKDPIDALRYALEHRVFAPARERAAPDVMRIG